MSLRLGLNGEQEVDGKGAAEQHNGAELEGETAQVSRYLAQQRADNGEIHEDDLVVGLLEQIEDSIQTQAQLFEQARVFQDVIDDMINLGLIIVVRPSEDALRPTGRVLCAPTGPAPRGTNKQTPSCLRHLALFPTLLWVGTRFE